MLSLSGLIPTVFAQENVDVMMINGAEVSDKAAMWVGGGFIAVFIFAAIIGLLCTIFWIWMLVHSITKPIENKAIWILILLVTQVLGAIVYYFAVKRPFDAVNLPVVQTPPTPPTA